MQIRLWSDDQNVWADLLANNIFVRKGWNYIGVHVDEIYEYSYVTIYHRSEYHISPGDLFNKYETVLRGVYRAAWPDGENDDIIILGCRSYYYTGSTNGARSYWPSHPSDLVYGLCMKGWINRIEIWS